MICQLAEPYIRFPAKSWGHEGINITKKFLTILRLCHTKQFFSQLAAQFYPRETKNWQEKLPRVTWP